MAKTKPSELFSKNYFKMSNAIFYYGLTPIQLAVYCYLVSCAGQKESCYPSIKTIAAACHCSKNAARDAVTELDRRDFINKVATYKDDGNGKIQQTNNTYYILYLPKLSPPPQPTYRESA